MSGRRKIVKAVAKELNEKRLESAIEELHPIFRKWAEASWNLLEAWKSWTLIKGELEVFLLNRHFYRRAWIEERRVEWLRGSETLSNLLSAKAVLSVAVMRHNPMELEIRVGYGFREMCIDAVPLLHFSDYLHLESEKHLEEIKKTVLSRFRSWKENHFSAALPQNANSGKHTDKEG
jgi:hypothetical protein